MLTTGNVELLLHHHHSAGDAASKGQKHRELYEVGTASQKQTFTNLACCPLVSHHFSSSTGWPHLLRPICRGPLLFSLLGVLRRYGSVAPSRSLDARDIQAPRMDEILPSITCHTGLPQPSCKSVGTGRGGRPIQHLASILSGVTGLML